MANTRIQRSQAATGDDAAPVTDVLLSRLYRAGPDEIASVVSPLSNEARAGLAGFCYGRAHLREIGREIATLCDDADLRRYAGGALGACLVEAKRAPVNDRFGADPLRPGRPKVRLASAADMKRPMPPLEMDGLDSDAPDLD